MTYSGCMWTWKEIYRHSYYFALILLWKVFKNLMHIIHAYYEQCVFHRYKVCKLLLNILWLGTLWLLYKYYKKTCIIPEKFVYRRTRKFTNVGQVGRGGGGGGGWRNGKIPKLVGIEGCMHSGGEIPRPICHYDLTCMGEFYYYNYYTSAFNNITNNNHNDYHNRFSRQIS